MAAPAFYKIDTAGAMGPRLRGCVKTRASRECAELFSPFSSFGDDWQSSSFPIHRNRERISTRKFEVGVFTQPGTPGPMTPGANCYGRHQTHCENESPRRMGPGLRRDDVLKLTASARSAPVRDRES